MMPISEHDFAKYMRKGYAREYQPSVAPSLFRHMVVIPVMDELAELPNTLKSLSVTLGKYGSGIAVLLVVNHAPDAAPERKEANLETLRRLWNSDPGFLGGLLPGQNLFWIDAASPGSEITRGVGEARRIGLDTALGMIDPEKRNDALLYSLDSDSPVEPDYLAKVERWFLAHRSCGAASLAVRHRIGVTPEAEVAIRRYEEYMLDYVENLRAAGSPYAFHTIGSAVVARATTYIAAGGMRVRSGGEDFYFMQALKKVAPMGEIEEPMVFPAARPSDRVPFGTGPAIRSQIEGKALPTYSAEGFAELKLLLSAATDEALRDPDVFRARLTRRGEAFLAAGNFFSLWPEALRHTPKRPGAAREAFDRWFDALKTLQFLHSFNKSE